jgi:hypothetical protein
MDRVYKEDIPSVVKTLQALRDEFVRLDSRTDWARLRIEPLLGHAKRLDRLLRSKDFVGETARLRVGVGMFHADLVYFRENIRGLKNVLALERKAALNRR